MIACTTPTPLHPWTDLYLPACDRDSPRVRSALSRIVSLPAGTRGDAAAVAARALLVLDRPAEARQMLGLARGWGGEEVDAFVSVSAQDMAALHRRTAEADGPGARADACCDLAAAFVAIGDVPGARKAIVDARAACPDHLEAGHWRRFLDWAPHPEVLLQRVAAREGLAPGPYVNDVLALVPRQQNGWISPERVARRKLAPEEVAPRGSGLLRLREAGAVGFWFALPVEYTLIGPDHPLVAMELRAETLLARVEEGRPAGGLAAALWRATTDESRGDAAQLIVAAGTRDDHMAPAAVVAVTWLLQHAPEQAALWWGYRAWHRHRAGDAGATQDAMRALQVPEPDPVGWYLAISTLFSQGARLLATKLASARLEDGRLGRMAADALREQDNPRPVTWISPRIVPRVPVVGACA